MLCLGVAQASGSTTFADWLAQHDVPADQRGFTDDPAGDGVANILKYALNLHPLQAARDELPRPELILHEGERRLGLTISRNPDAVGVEYVVEASGDLGDWSAATVQTIEESATSLTVVDTASGGKARRFLRLAIPPLPEGPLPDAYLFVVGGRLPGGSHEAMDPELDFAINENVRSILVADLDLEGSTVTNWRRAGTLPLQHPVRVDTGGEPLPVQWNYIHNHVHVHNGRLYVSCGTVGTGAGTTADFVAWADIDAATGGVGEFSLSDVFPEPLFQRIGASAMVEVDGVMYYYILGGNSADSYLSRILYAPIDPETGAVGSWQVSSTPLPQVDWFNAAIGINGRIIHTNGHQHGTSAMKAHWVAPESGGNITSSFTEQTYSWTASRRWDHLLERADVDGQTFIYTIGGVTDLGTLATVEYTPLAGGVPPGGEWDVWPVTDPLPAPRRRVAGGSIGNTIIVAGGSPTTAFADGVATVFIGTVAADGNVTWSQSEEGMMQPRSYHGAVIAPLPNN